MINRRLRPSPSMVVAFVALFMAIGGGSYALAALPSRSVGAKQLKRGAVRTANLSNNAVTGAKVRRDALTGADIRENTLAGVAGATNAGHANAAGALDRVTMRARQAASRRAVSDAMGGITATIGGGAAVCPAGQLADRRRRRVPTTTTETSVVDSFPDPGGRAWRVAGGQQRATVNTFTVVAVCVPAGAAG